MEILACQDQLDLDCFRKDNSVKRQRRKDKATRSLVGEE